MTLNGESMINIFKIKELKNDFIISVILGVLFIAIIYFLDLNFIFFNISNSLGTILSISVTLVGFLITSLTILFVFPENNRMRFVKAHPTYKYVFYAFIVSIILFVVIAILSFVFKILTPYVPSFFLSLLIVLFVWAMVSLFRCLWLLKKIIDVYFYKSEGSQDGDP